MKIKFLHCLWMMVLGASAMLSGGCASAPQEDHCIPEVVVVRTAKPIKADGVLDEDEWKKAPWHNFERIDYYKNFQPREQALILQDHYEKARVKFLYDDKNLYVGCELEDRDVIALLNKNQEMLYRYGDLLEIFVSVDEPGGHYWELYAAPNGCKTSYFYPSSAMLLEHFLQSELVPGLQVACKVNGTLNDHSDCDKGWSAEMVIPLKALERYGFKFNSSVKWRIMAARYNYGRTFYRLQPSTYPLQPGFGFHSRQYYSPVVFR